MALVAAGAGAGIAAAFNAPIAGVLFVVEEMRREAPYNFQGYHAVLIACVAATLVTEVVAGVGPELRLPMTAPQLAHYPVVRRPRRAAGCRSAWRSIASCWPRSTCSPAGRGGPAGPWFSPCPLGLTALLFVLPAATGGGEQLIQPLVAPHRPLGSLLVLLARPSRGDTGQLRRRCAGRRLRTDPGPRHRGGAGFR